MEENNKGNCNGENGSEINNNNNNNNEGLPPIPIPLAASFRQCFSATRVSSTRIKTLLRHPSLNLQAKTPEIPIESLAIANCESKFLPIVRSGAWTDIGFRSSMEDVCVCVDDFMHRYGLEHISEEGPNAFYGVFDGHGGRHAADFACSHLPQFIFENEGFPAEIERVITSAFLQTDNAFAEACLLDAELPSGTTALTALVLGRSLIVANAGDCRAVLSRRGKAIEMSKDHKPHCSREKKRIEASGGYVDDGYLNGQLNVARALGNWHMEGIKRVDGGPLTAEPELMTMELTQEDEFLIIGCDGLWDVFRSQNAVDFARRRLQEHNDPLKCSKDLVDEALKRKSGDNLAVVVICFQDQPPPNLIVPRARVQRSVSAEGLRELQSFLDSLKS